MRLRGLGLRLKGLWQSESGSVLRWLRDTGGYVDGDT